MAVLHWMHFTRIPVRVAYCCLPFLSLVPSLANVLRMFVLTFINFSLDAHLKRI